MKTLSEWKQQYDQWADVDPNCASTGQRRDDAELDGLAAWLAERLQLAPGESLLDVGCSTGALTTRLARHAGPVTGVDFSEALIEAARRHHAGTGVTFVPAEAADLPFADATFDKGCCFGVLGTLPETGYARRSIAELVRVVRPGGIVVVGSLPDDRRKHAFFDQLDAALPWWRRSVPRVLRWGVKKLLCPTSRPGQTQIRWFDVEVEAALLRANGIDVTVIDDPQYAGYSRHRSTLVLRKPSEPWQ